MGVDFEKSFSDYLDSKEYDDGEAALFSIVRGAYKAGRDAAGGTTPKQQEILHLYKNVRGGDNNDQTHDEQ